jgi:hypothetical protein
MTQTETLRLALEALEVANSLVDDYYLPKEKALMPEIEEAITAIKAALEAKDEPDHSDELTIAYMSGLHRGKEVAQRTWVGLTPEEEEEIITKAHSGAGWRFYIRETEAKLKAKNAE